MYMILTYKTECNAWKVFNGVIFYACRCGCSCLVIDILSTEPKICPNVIGPFRELSTLFLTLDVTIRRFCIKDVSQVGRELLKVQTF